MSSFCLIRSVDIVWRHVEYEGENAIDKTTIDFQHPKTHEYSRGTTPVTSRVEAVLSQITVSHPTREL